MFVVIMLLMVLVNSGGKKANEKESLPQNR